MKFLPVLSVLVLMFALLSFQACGQKEKSGNKSSTDGDIDDEAVSEYDNQSESDATENEGSESEHYSIEPSSKALLTRAGAHSNVWFQAQEENGFPLPGLYYRQYSDMYSHFGMFRPLLNPLAALSVNEACTLNYHQWRASHTVREYDCGGLSVTETAHYADLDKINIRFKIRNNGADTEFKLSGTAAFDLENTLLKKSDGVEITINGHYAHLWSDAIPAQWKASVTVSPGPEELEIDKKDATWTMHYSIAESKTTELLFELELNETTPALAGTAPKAMQDESIAAYDIEISNWLSQAPDKQLLSKPFYSNAWYLFFENSAAPLGNWLETSITPSKRHYFRGVWLWDSAFHALALSEGGNDAQSLARMQIDNFVKQPFSDGHLSREIWVTDKNPGIQPPGLLTWASLVLAGYRKDSPPSPETSALERLSSEYDIYKANHQWFLNTRDSDIDGLYEWEGTDSGWDTSPRWDGGAVEALDLACWLQLDAALLARMAQILDKNDEKNGFEAEALAMAERIRNEFWDENDGFFYDLKIDNGDFVRVKTPATFVPLFTGVATQTQAERVSESLSDENIFATPFGLPSVSPDFEEYNPKDYWRGPVWIVTNAFAIWGLERYGLNTQAQKLKTNTLSMMEQFETTYEYYNSQTGEGIGAPDFMWSAAFYIMLNGKSPVIW